MELTIGEQLKLLRQRAGLSQEQLGGTVELSSYTIGKIESGETSPRLEQLEAIGAALGAVVEVSIAMPSALVA